MAFNERFRTDLAKLGSSVRRYASYNAYIWDLNSGKRLNFRCPENIAETVTTEWSEEKSLYGVGESIGFEHAGFREPQVSFVLHEDLLDPTDGFVTIQEACNFVRSLMYPNYNGTLIAPSAFVQILNVSLWGVLKDVTIDWRRNAGLRDGRFVMADISFTIKEKVLKRPTADDILKGGM